MFDPIYFKSQFPLFDHSENQSLVYLDNAATTQKPQCVIDAIVDFYTKANGNANRSSHRLARVATNLLEKARLQAAEFIGAESKNTIVFTSGATESLNIIANGFRDKLSSGDEIILSLVEHHANIVPWQEVCHSSNAKLVFAEINLNNVKSLVNKKTKIISVTAASNALGLVTDLNSLREIKKQYPDIIIVLDGSQLVAHKPVDIKSWPCDFFVCSAHKFYGPTGVGLLYGRESLLSCLLPLKFGGEMIDNVELHKSYYVTGPERFEGGTSPLSAIAALSACFDFWSKQDRAQMVQYENLLTGYLYEKINKLCDKYPEIYLVGDKKSNIGIATLASNQYSMADIGFWLDEENIAVRVGNHCAQPLFRSLNVRSVLRISLAAYNTREDIDKCVSSFEGFLRENSQPYLLPKEKGYFDVSLLDYRELYGLNNWQHRYKKIMQWGSLLPSRPRLRSEENLVVGCESFLWLSGEKKEGKYYFWVDSDSAVVKGLAAVILCRVFGEKKETILAIDFQQYFLDLGLEKHLSQSRVNGVNAILKSVFDYAER